MFKTQDTLSYSNMGVMMSVVDFKFSQHRQCDVLCGLIGSRYTVEAASILVIRTPTAGVAIDSSIIPERPPSRDGATNTLTTLVSEDTRCFTDYHGIGNGFLLAKLTAYNQCTLEIRSKKNSR